VFARPVPFPELLPAGLVGNLPGIGAVQPVQPLCGFTAPAPLPPAALGAPLGLAGANGTAPLGLPAQPALPAAPAATRLTLAEYRERLVAIYEVHKPDNVPKVDYLMEKYRGNVDFLYSSVCTKYGIQPDVVRLNGITVAILASAATRQFATMRRFLPPAAAANSAANAAAATPRPAALHAAQAPVAATVVAHGAPSPALAGAERAVAAGGATFAAALRKRAVVHGHTARQRPNCGLDAMPRSRAADGAVAALPVSQMLQLVRDRTYLTMIQAGGAYRIAGVNALRESVVSAGGPSDFVRYAAHRDNKVEHHFRVFDAASRCHFLGARSYAQSERHSLACHVARCILLVDPAPVKAFYAHLEGMAWLTSTQAFADALDAGLAEHGADRPRAYKPWGRGLPAGDAAGSLPDDSDDEDEEVGVDYLSRRSIVRGRVLEMLDIPPASRGPSSISYAVPSLQRLAGAREREGVLMDLILSACRAQRKRAWTVRKAFYMAGSGCLVRGDMGAISAFAQAAKANATFKKQCSVLRMKCTILDMWMFCEHASCAIRKYGKTRMAEC
ncbi:unnamed protein product, partial [Prorocentrum cordatum]